MVKIYEQAKDINIAATVIYTKNNKAYKDISCETQYTSDELRDAFLKGSVINIQPGVYDNPYSIHTSPTRFNITQRNTGAVTFAVPHIRRNKYQGYVCDEVEKVSVFGTDVTAESVPDRKSLFVHGGSSKPDAPTETMGIEFGEGTLLYSVLSELGNVPKTISISVDKWLPPSVPLILSCGEDSTLIRYMNSRVSLTTTGNVVRLYQENIPAVSFEINSVQVELGDQATPYETPADKDWEDISYAESIPDPT